MQSRWRLRIAMHRLGRECRQAYGDVFRPTFFGRGVLDPLAGVCDDSLTGADVDLSAVMTYAQHAFQYNRELIELRSLPRLLPTLGTAHVRDTGGFGLRID